MFIALYFHVFARVELILRHFSNTSKSISELQKLSHILNGFGMLVLKDSVWVSLAFPTINQFVNTVVLAYLIPSKKMHLQKVNISIQILTNLSPNPSALQQMRNELKRTLFKV